MHQTKSEQSTTTFSQHGSNHAEDNCTSSILRQRKQPTPLESSMALDGRLNATLGQIGRHIQHSPAAPKLPWRQQQRDSVPRATISRHDALTRLKFPGPGCCDASTTSAYATGLYSTLSCEYMPPAGSPTQVPWRKGVGYTDISYIIYEPRCFAKLPLGAVPFHARE